ncbi:carbohydrate-binding protein [Myxosarcina sp. GI1]|uniref:carbohydrate-binding protein n=1 Tax=Myxosarcina sp. GI1 TaxID=1541065 RepID=UPI00155AEE93|nr:carbohydrate-binding protein [Myxosarcina sp. GI1]
MDNKSSANSLQTPFNGEAFVIGDTKKEAYLQVEHFDNGGAGVSYQDFDRINHGGDYRQSKGVDIEKTNDVGGGYNLFWLANDEWLEYTTDVTAGTYDLKFRVAAPNDTSGSLNVKLDDKLLGQVTVTGTNDWQNWRTIELQDVELDGGEDKILRLEVDGGYFNLNWLAFEQQGANDGTKDAANNKVENAIVESKSSVLNAVEAQNTNNVNTSNVKARSTDDFLDSIGVIVQAGNRETAYGNFDSVIKPRLDELDVRHLRTNVSPDDDTTISRLKELAKLGMEFNLVMDPEELNLDESVALVEEFGAAVESVEGPNEWNHTRNETYEGQNFPNGLSNYQADLYRAIKSDPDTANIPVIAPSLSNAFGVKTDVAELGRVKADFNNAHHYPSGLNPYNDELFWHLPIYYKLSGADKPLIVTETGYFNSTQYPKGISEEAAGKYLPRLLLEYFNLGIERTYLYELINDRASDSREFNFGLLRADGSKKPGFVAIENMIDILDSGGVGSSGGRNSLDFAIGGDTKDIHQTLLSKEDGKFYLALWQEVPSYDLNTNSNINVPAKNLTLNFGSNIQQAKVYEPNLSKESQQTVSNVNSMDVNVSDKVMLLEVVV